ncbi:MAG: 50S ribosomal protein L29 [Lentisphaeria bacterium]|nr:50S ribosomal protein L29 [Lentisphaeria bacterium]NQZ67481.1 50S ribosomal protein L29 [Lentisphaeria bacterium]
MKASDIRELTDDELEKQVDDSQRELFNLKIQAKNGQLENTVRIRYVRRTVARLLTERKARNKNSEAVS